MKVCNECGKEKPLKQFNKNGEGYRAKCRVCSKKLQKLTWQMATKRNQEYVREVKAEGCSRCGESRYICLDFHHVRDKKYWISKLVASGASLDKLKEEVSKCIILCANCHRVEHEKL